MVEETNTNSKYEKDRILMEQEPSKVNHILNPYDKIRETIKDMINDEE